MPGCHFLLMSIRNAVYFCNARHGPCTCFLFSDLQLSCRLERRSQTFCDGESTPDSEAQVSKILGQKLQELKQLLLTHPVKVFVTLVISRGLWIPLLKNCTLRFCGYQCCTSHPVLPHRVCGEQTSEEAQKRSGGFFAGYFGYPAAAPFVGT